MAKRSIPREAFALHEERSRKLRKASIKYIQEQVPEKKVAAFLSSGADSHFALFAAIHAGKVPTIYSCTMEDRESRDFRCAYQTAKTLGLNFVPVYLPTDVKHIIKYVPMMYDDSINPGVKIGKASIEVNWPVTRMMAAVQERAIINGFNGDAWFCTLRSHKKKFQAGTFQRVLDNFEAFAKLDAKYGNDPLKFQGREIQHILRLAWIKRFHPKLRMVSPFVNPKIFPIMHGMEPFKEGWNPIQKAPWRLAFWEEFEQCRDSIYVNSPLQKGDSGIEEHFHKLLTSKLNVRGMKTTIGIYNDFLEKWRERDLARNPEVDDDEEDE